MEGKSVGLSNEMKTTGQQGSRHILRRLLPTTRPCLPIPFQISFSTLLVVFVVLAAVYNIVTPIGESDNELSHYRYIQYIHNHWQLPPVDYEWPQPPVAQCSLPAAKPAYQFRQPPLYYVLGALAFFWRDMSDTWWPDVNPYGWHSLNMDGGRNLFLHTAQEEFPYRGVVLTVRVLRLFSTLIGLLGLVAVWRAARLLFPNERRLALSMTALVAFNPAYIFSSAVINNDILVAALGLWAVYFALYGLLAPHAERAAVGMVVFFALAMLSKYSAALIAPFLILSLLVIVVQAKRRLHMIKGRHVAWGIVGALAAFMPVAWWFWRNWTRYGFVLPGYTLTILSMRYKLRVLTQTPWPELAATIGEGVRFTFITYWGLLGVDALLLPDPLLTLFGIITALGAVGVVWRLLRDRNASARRRIALLSILGLALAWWTGFLAGFYAPRGRYILALYSLIAFLLVWGSSAFRLRLANRTLSLTDALLGLLIFASVYAPFGILRPTFQPPDTRASPDPAPGEMVVRATVDDLAELVSMDVQPRDVGPGDDLQVTLRWRVLSDTPNNYVVGVHLTGADGSYLGGTAHWPANGRYPTSLWRPGDVFLDTYRFQVKKEISATLPLAARVLVSVYCQNREGEERPLTVFDARGTPVGDFVLSAPIRLGPQEPPPPPPTPLVTFGEEIGLVDITGLPEDIWTAQGETVLTMRWVALKRPRWDYTVYVQLLDGENRVRASADYPLTQGYYPSSLWRPGEVVTHRHPINLAALRALPPGTYRLVVGLYHLESGERLSARGNSNATPEGYVLRIWDVPPIHRHALPWVNIARPDERD